jgi:hypothetical protein
MVTIFNLIFILSMMNYLVLNIIIKYFYLLIFDAQLMNGIIL